ncbi:tectonin beta-propeller repeat-containing protein [Ischnura elegans]|uniref:tectonin beta-propeller repeat-containing protein n=1 Tax=Ischnura elegans TaxID=197161 RepID=UPI001ED876B1|nr:tectonin beta-propeller repeat-containing protein [Ischnura elegans]
MPLFAVSNEGRLHKLLTPHDGHSGCTVDSGEFEDPSNDYVIWQELPYLGVEIKQASAGGRSVWALGGDRQIYVLVHSVDLPIRIKEEAFENQRWIPLGYGFSKNLLPTDRPHFSSEDGLVERELERVVLPSPAWQWEESSWRVEASLNGQPLDAEGWTYAVDFPAAYHPEKSWKSCVRRRKWVRHRVYAAVDGWSAIPPLNDKDPTEEPFIDICVGGQSIVGAPKGHLSVWAVTAKGRVLYREGVTWTCPEGVGWSEVAVGSSEEAQEVKQVGVGPMGDAWCILWNGHALVRAGVARDHLKGDLWVSLQPPSPGAPLPGSCANGSGATSAPLSQISVGTWGAWAVTVDGRTWYRRGIRSSNGGGGSATERLLGQGWVEMVGCMSVISVGPNDQVWAIGMEDRLLYMRTGVLLPSEPTGRAWRRMQLPVAVPTQLPDGYQLESSSRNRQLPSMSRESSVSREEACVGTEGESLFRRGVSEEARPTGNVVHGSSLRNRAALAASGAVASSLALLGNAASHSSAAVADAGERAGGDESETESCAFGHPHEEDDDWEGGWGSEEEGGEGGLEQPSSLEEGGGKKSRLKAEPLWAWVTGGSCVIDPHQNPPWFMESALGCDMASLSLEDDSSEGDGLRKHGSGKGSRPTQAWRTQLLHLMRERRDREEAPLELNHFEEAIETSSWVKSGKVLCLLPSSSTLTPHSCTLELEWVYGAGCVETEGDAAKQDAGTLTALSADGNRTLLQWSLSDIRCIAPCKGWGVSDASSDGSLSPAANDADSESPTALYSQPRLAIHSTQATTPLRLQFASEKDLEDWTSILTSVCCQLQGLQGPPKPGSIWAATSNGDVFVFDPSNLKLEQWEGRGHGNNLTGENEVGHFAMEWSFRGKQAPYTRDLPNGMPTGSTVEIHGTISNKPKRFAVNLIVGSGKKNQRTIALHLNPRFESDNCVSVVCNSMVNGTWQEEERPENCELAPGNDFIITIGTNNDCFQVHIQGQQVMADNVSICSSSSAAPLTSTTLCFNHRISPNSISLIEINGDATITTVSYASPQVIVGMESVFWRQVGGHFRVVEACPLGVVWAIAYDGTPWIHTGGWGGAFLEGMGEATTSQHLLGSGGDGGVGRGSSAGAKVQAMSDTRAVHVYENQRWNPLTRYSSVGLPTDRPSWSDRSGRHRRSKDSSRLPSRHWHWATEWSVDFSVSGGVDSEGWQYAFDFPATFHASRGFTDYVRRRRWVRVAKLSTQGPWRPLPHTPLASVSLHADEEPIEGDGEGVASLWAIAANSGEVLYRHGVTKSTPAGSSWDCVVGGEQPFVDISCGGHNQVWAIGRNGAAYWRFGINSASPTGQVWVHVEPPAGRKLRQISVAEWERAQLTVWALDSVGTLYVRREMTPVFPEGTHWQPVGEVERGHTQAFGHVSVGPGGEVWATHSSSGCVLRRLGRHAADTFVDPAWARGVNASMQYVSTHGWRLKMS